VYLADMALTHHWQHFGEALTIRSLVLDAGSRGATGMLREDGG
jgi:hypothetical protein